MSSLRLSTKHGLNPTMFMCVRCGKDAEIIGLLGITNKIKCTCGTEFYGILHKGKTVCPRCGLKGCLETIVYDCEAPNHLKGGLCPECEKEINEHQSIILKGGIYWKCSDCHSNGVIRETSDLAIAVRKQSGIKPPFPVGVEFSKEHNCPVCNKGE